MLWTSFYIYNLLTYNTQSAISQWLKSGHISYSFLYIYPFTIQIVNSEKYKNFSKEPFFFPLYFFSNFNMVLVLCCCGLQQFPFDIVLSFYIQALFSVFLCLTWFNHVFVAFSFFFTSSFFLSIMPSLCIPAFLVHCPNNTPNVLKCCSCTLLNEVESFQPLTHHCQYIIFACAFTVSALFYHRGMQCVGQCAQMY